MENEFEKQIQNIIDSFGVQNQEHDADAEALKFREQISLGVDELFENVSKRHAAAVIEVDGQAYISSETVRSMGSLFAEAGLTSAAYGDESGAGAYGYAATVASVAAQRAEGKGANEDLPSF